MAVTLTINGSSVSYPSIVSGTADEEWGDDATTAMQTLAAAVIYKGGSVELTADWDVGDYSLTMKTLTLDVADGTAPMTVTSTTKVSNLNSDKVDGADLDTDGTLTANSDSKVPSQKAVKTYVDGSSSSRGIQVLISGNAYVADGIVWARVPYAMTAASCRLGVSTAPTAADLIVDIEYHATAPGSTATIFNTKPEIAATAYSGTSSDLSTTSLAAGGFLKFNIDQIGATLPGTNLIIELNE